MHQHSPQIACLISNYIYRAPKPQLHLNAHCQCSWFQNTCHLSTCLSRWCQKTIANRRRKELSIHAPTVGNARIAWHCHRSWPKSSQTFCDIFALCCCLQQRAKKNELAGRIIIGDVASKGPGNVITGIPAKFVAGAFCRTLHFSFAASSNILCSRIASKPI